MKDAVASILSTTLVLLVVVVMLLLSGVIGCAGPTQEPVTCPVLATLPTGEVVDVPREPSCPLPGPRPVPTLARSVEVADVLYSSTMNEINERRWSDEAELYISCITALPAGEP